MTASADSKADAIHLNLVMHSSSLTLLLFSLFKMTMSTLLLHMKQAAVDQPQEQN